MWRQQLIPSKFPLPAVVVAAALIILARPTIQSAVSVKNEMSDKKLIVHCQSKDDDIGSHVVDVGLDLHWDFLAEIGTQFWCNLAVEDKHLSFDAYQQSDRDLCCGHMYWKVRDDGVHLVDPDDGETKSYRREWKHL
ncbi:unnamed protein product [Linum trigynum]|uniref:S-protein homolog n=1 Tax=Linum trigynum TaxID=586398 RepID=A0AAV2D2Y3_9ROSI